MLCDYINGLQEPQTIKDMKRSCIGSTREVSYTYVLGNVKSVLTDGNKCRTHGEYRRKDTSVLP